MRYFVQGLRPEIREIVLMKQPKTFRVAEEMDYPGEIKQPEKNSRGKRPEKDVRSFTAVAQLATDV